MYYDGFAQGYKDTTPGVTDKMIEDAWNIADYTQRGHLTRLEFNRIFAIG